MSLGGYMGRILRVNVTDGSHETVPLDYEMARAYLGGNGFIARWLYDELAPGTDPLSPESPLIITNGPANGLAIPMASKFAVGAKSPLTHTHCDSFCSGPFGVQLKYAGYDAVVIEGRAEELSYLLVDDDTIELRPADHLSGKLTTDTQETIRQELSDPSAGIACIGPAGESLVLFACIISDLRAAGTGGLGAVMGSKNLKAVVARGTHTLTPPDPQLLHQVTEALKEQARTLPGAKVLSTYGTSAGVAGLQAMGAFPTRNWQQEVFEGWDDISGETLRDEHVRRDLACIGCLTPCGNYSTVEEGEYAGAEAVGPEYEAQFALGSIVGNRRLDALIKADRLTDEYGLGQITAGAAIAFAMECFEEGVIGLDDTDGLDLCFGSHQALIEMLRRIAYREGIGDLLADGSERAAERIGRGAERFAHSVKGMDIVGHSPRAVKSQALAYAVSSRGPVHCDIRPASEESGLIERSIEGKGAECVELCDWTAVANSIIWCISAERLIGMKLTPIVQDIVGAAWGQSPSLEELRDIGARINHLERVFNMREGFRRSDDRLPRRITDEPIPSGASEGWVTPQTELDRMLDEYYTCRGWDLETGIPLPKTLRALGLHREADDMLALLDE